ncbi:hypothetical protein ASPACDRAFT_30966, partial [Aspergillus aculeatus ATCC 16872]
GPDPNYSMISTVFTLISGVGLLLVGRLGDIFGRRYILIGGQLLGLVGAIVCATAKNVPTVIGGSVLCGLAAAVQLTFTFVIAELVPNRARPAVNASIFITTLPFSAFGSIIASDFVAHTAASWRWTYYLNMITCGLSIILLVLFYFPPGWDQKRGGQSRLDGLKKFDWIGFVLYAAGVVLVLLGLCMCCLVHSWGGTSYAWSSAHVVAVLVVGFVSIIVFVLYEIYAPLEQPLLPMSLLRNPGYAATVCSALVGNMVYFSMSLLWPEAVLYLFTTNTIKAGWLSFTAIGGFAVGYLELITLIMCPLYCKPEDIGLASGFLGSAKQIFGTIATAIYVAILQNRITANLPTTVTHAATKAGLPSSSLTDLLEAVAAGTSAALEAVPGMTTKILAAVADAEKTAYAMSFRTVFCVSIAFGGLSIIASLFSREVDTRLDGGVAAKLQGKGEGQSPSPSHQAWEAKGVADEEAR